MRGYIESKSAGPPPSDRPRGVYWYIGNQYTPPNSLCAAVPRPDAPRCRGAQHRGRKYCKYRLCTLARAARGLLERTPVMGVALAGAPACTAVTLLPQPTHDCSIPTPLSKRRRPASPGACASRSRIQ
eukprot:295077-Chlamydomonas_euryale.AAC.1